MKLTSKARYGLLLCYELGKEPNKSLSTSDLFALTGYSVKYIEKLMNHLKKADIVTSERGANGGYRLSRDASKITLGQIIRPLENNLQFIKCVGNNCKNEKNCPSFSVWQKLYDGINELLDSMTLKEIIDDNINKGDNNEKDNIFRPCSNNRH